MSHCVPGRLMFGIWKVGSGISSVARMVRTDTPRKGDVAYREHWQGMNVQNHAISFDVIGTGSKAIIITIDGNSGQGSSITKNEAARSNWDLFYSVESLVDQ